MFTTPEWDEWARTPPENLLDALRTDQSNHWRGGNPVKVEEYLTKFPTVAANPTSSL